MASQLQQEGIEPTETQAAPWRQAAIGFFMEVAQFLGIPKSVGQVYGALFSSPAPLSPDELMSALSLSKAGVSKALDYLKRYEAVVPAFQLGDRRTRYAAELDLAKVVQGFFRAQVERDFRSWGSQLEFGRQVMQHGGREVFGDDDPAFVRERFELLAKWFSQAQASLPLLEAHFAKTPPATKPDPR
ncbi:MAG: GbsR/MarR family transcriptional regulator [Opitutales bacterium]